MILKYGDNDNGWSWIGDVRRATHYPDDSDWEVDLGNASEKDSCILEIQFNNGEKIIYNFAAKKIYLCNDDTGSTIDVIKN